MLNHALPRLSHSTYSFFGATKVKSQFRAPPVSGLAMSRYSVKQVVHKHGRKYALMPDGVGVPFEVYGTEGNPGCILTPGGKGGIEYERPMAKMLAQAGFRAVVHDRRNTWAADVGFGNGSKTELDLQVEDSVALIRHLKMEPAVFIGESSGARMSIRCALKHPSAVRGLIVRNMTGGKNAANAISFAYHFEFVQPCELGGMEAVTRSYHYSEMISHNPDVRQQLLQTNPELFIKVQKDSGNQLKRWDFFLLFCITYLLLHVHSSRFQQQFSRPSRSITPKTGCDSSNLYKSTSN